MNSTEKTLWQSFIDLLFGSEQEQEHEYKPPAETWYETSTRISKLMPYQQEAVKWLAGRKRALLADQQGLGKTAETLLALPDRAATLVICPAIAKGVWELECRKWRSDLRPSVLNGVGSFRFPGPKELVIVNFDLLPPWFSPSPSRFLQLPTLNHLSQSTRILLRETNVIIDEAHKVSNYARTLRGRNIWGLSLEAKRVWALTGTPLLNRPTDLHGLLTALGLFEEVFGTYRNFLKLFHAYSKGFNRFGFGDPDPEVPHLLRRVMLRRTREQVLPDLPRKRFSNWIVKNYSGKLKDRLDGEQRKREQIPDSKRTPFELTATISAELATAKIPAMLQLVQEHEANKIPFVVASAHLATIRELAKRAGWGIIIGNTTSEKRQEIANNFQAGKLWGVAGTIGAMGTAITLTRAWKLLEVDLDWVPANNLQVEDRICRIGQTRECEIMRLVIDHPLERHRTKLLAEKMRLFEQTVENRNGRTGKASLHVDNFPHHSFW